MQNKFTVIPNLNYIKIDESQYWDLHKKKFNMSNFFSKNSMKFSQESFKPPIKDLPESLFYGNCCDILTEFLQESKIHFQIYQDET